jgi:carotenoid cleavage dioxygenase-like enzyme
MPSLSATQTANVPGRVRGFLSGAREIDGAEVAVTGSLPPWLRGTLLLNGPALWELPDGRLEHWFDGYAMWHALRISDDGVRYRSRFAQSESFRRSSSTGTPAYGEFGTANPAGLMTRLRAPQATDNPAVVMSRHGSRWCSVTETPHLTYFDPETLQTQERLDLSRRGEGMHLMAAHGLTLRDGSYLNVGIELGPSCVIKLFRIAPGGVSTEVVARIKTRKSGYTHGFGLALGHAVIWETALRAQPLAFRFGARSYADNFRWEPEGGSSIHVVSLDTGAVRTWYVPPMMAFHATQAWSEGNDFMLDVAIYEGGSVFEDLTLERRRADAAVRNRPSHVRYTLKDGKRETEPAAIAGGAIELQQVHPDKVGRERAKVCWAAATGESGALLDRTCRVDLDSGNVTTWKRPGATHLEPLFVPKPGLTSEDEGVLLVPTLSDTDETTVVGIIDARTMNCVAELRTPQIVPFGFHAAFRAH